MEYKKVKDFCLMKIGTADSGVNITKDAVIKSIDTFRNTPILIYPDLSEGDINNKTERMAGFVTEDVRIEDDKVLATVMMDKNYYKKKECTNWQIKLDGVSDDKVYNPPYFQFSACEVN